MRVKIAKVDKIGSGNYVDRVGRFGTVENLSLYEQFILRYENEGLEGKFMLTTTVQELHEVDNGYVVVTINSVYYLEVIDEC